MFELSEEFPCVLRTTASKVAVLRLLESARPCDCSRDDLCLNLLENYGHSLFPFHAGSFCFVCCVFVLYLPSCIFSQLFTCATVLQVSELPCTCLG